MFRSDYVVGRVAGENQLLQHWFARSSERLHCPGLIRFVSELSRLAFHLYLLNLMVDGLERHGLLLPFHGVLNMVW